MSSKFYALDYLAGFLGQFRSTVLCHGCFDYLHIGHIRHLEAARKLGQRLIVTVTPDCFVAKGNGRPVFNQAERVEALCSLACVDYVAINQWPTAVPTIKLLKPAIYAKGWDSREKPTDGLRAEIEAIESVGGKMLFTETLAFHTTDLIERLRG